MSLVYLILGGNQGNRTEIISTAIELVTNNIGEKRAISASYESESWGFESELFINQVIKLESSLSPDAVLAQIHLIEAQLGRIRKTGSYEARTIDIDLLYFDALVINTPNLTIPHPRISERRFVLEPLCEIAPELQDPITGKTVLEMLLACKDPSKVWLLNDK